MLSLAIIGIHLTTNGYFRIIFRIAVPIFFILAGYFTFGKSIEKLKKAILKDLKILLIGIFAYFCWEVFFYFKEGTLTKFLKEDVFSFENLKRFIIFNEPKIGGHLWFISALLYCKIIYFLYKKYIRNSVKVESITVVVLISIGTIFAEIIPILYGQRPIKELCYYRNFLFLGLPYFLIGTMLRNINIKENQKTYVFYTIISTFFYFLETYIIYKLKNELTLEYYFSGIFLSISIILISISYKNKISEENILAEIGRNYSIYIYIVHIACIDVANIILKNIGIRYGNILPLRYLLVTILSIICSIIIKKIIYIKNKLIEKHRTINN